MSNEVESQFALHATVTIARYVTAGFVCRVDQLLTMGSGWAEHGSKTMPAIGFDRLRVLSTDWITTVEPGKARAYTGKDHTIRSLHSEHICGVIRASKPCKQAMFPLLCNGRAWSPVDIPNHGHIPRCR
jgi:hypothetical protein